MRFITLSLFLFLVLYSCKESSEPRSDKVISDTIQTHVFNVESLADSALVDTLTTMIFTTSGIEQMLIKKAENVIIIEANSNYVSEEELKAEIINRGAVVK